MELWIPITVAAAFSQNLRSALQRHLKGNLSISGATFVRFVYAAPLAGLYVWGLSLSGLVLPTPNATFVAYAMAGGITQILAAASLVYLFSYHNFAIGATYSKTETIQTARFGVVILGETISAGAVIGILVSLVGVVVISVASGGVTVRNLLEGLLQRTSLIGLASGALFGLSAVSYRAASLALNGEGFLMQAAFTLACVTVFQTLVMSAYMRWREPGEITRSFRMWRVAAVVGVCGMIASACWFSAMTLQNAAYVRAVGQLELVFTFAASYLFFRERCTPLELTGMGMVIIGIVVLLLVR